MTQVWPCPAAAMDCTVLLQGAHSEPPDTVQPRTNIQQDSQETAWPLGLPLSVPCSLSAGRVPKALGEILKWEEVGHTYHRVQS